MHLSHYSQSKCILQLNFHLSPIPKSLEQASITQHARKCDEGKVSVVTNSSYNQFGLPILFLKIKKEEKKKPI